MKEETKLERYVIRLQGDFRIMTNSLQILKDLPVGDVRILPYLEALLDDNRPCVLSIPNMYGVVRWNAAKAIVAERSVHKITTPITLVNVVKPITPDKLAALVKEVNLLRARGSLEALQQLMNMGKVPLYTEFVFDPADGLANKVHDSWLECRNSQEEGLSQ